MCEYYGAWSRDQLLKINGWMPEDVDLDKLFIDLYEDERWLARSRFAWLCVIPAMAVVLALTNQWHHLIWAEYEFLPTGGITAMRVVSYGIWFLVQTAYAYILVLWGDDIGWWNISYNSRGQMGYRTPNIDRVGNEGVAFTDYYAQQSCTAGRAAFITGQHPFPDASSGDLVAKHLQESLPYVRDTHPDLPAALDGVIQRSTAKDPADRYPSAAALAADSAGDSLTRARVYLALGQPDQALPLLARGWSTLTPWTAACAFGVARIVGVGPHPQGSEFIGPG